MNPSRVPFRRVPIIRLAIRRSRNAWHVPHELTFPVGWLLAVIATVVSICAVVVPASAQGYTILFNFPGGITGSTPRGLTIDAAGRLYGATLAGGNGGGTVFRLSRAGSGWVLTTLYPFRGTTDGSTPGVVVFGPDGALYGATSAGGGACNCGVVFSLRPPPNACTSALCPWTETVLYEFQGAPDGAEPCGSPVVFDQAGNLYGTTVAGGSGVGTVYELTHGSGGWTENILYTFGGNDGAYPCGSLTLDEAGNLYGTTENGGTGEIGTVYELSPSASGWTHSILYSFEGAGIPTAGVLFDPVGNLYGGTLLSPGNAFELSPNGRSWNYPSLYQFNGAGDYGGVAGNLLRDPSGNLYGGVTSGGPHDQGSIFELSPGIGGWTYTDSHDFAGGTDGSGPQNMVRDTSGNLYGSASYGGEYGVGLSMR